MPRDPLDELAEYLYGLSESILETYTALIGDPLKRVPWAEIDEDGRAWWREQAGKAIVIYEP